MRPAYTDDTNVVFYLSDPETGEKIKGADLPVERFIADDVPGSDKGIAHESTWIPDQGERRAIANGAPFHLRVWGTRHPPVQVLAGEPPALEPGQLRALMDERHVSRAIGHLYGQIAGALTGGDAIDSLGKIIDPEAFLHLWNQALADTAEPHEQAAAADPTIDPTTGMIDLRGPNAKMPREPLDPTDAENPE